MDFVERWFNACPDGGTGVFEALCIAGVLAAVVVVVLGRAEVARVAASLMSGVRR